MTEKSPPRTDRGSSPQCPAAATADADVNNSTIFKVKNFTSETNDDDNNNNAATALLNILIDENKSTQKSIAFLNRNIHESLVLLKDKKTKDRERSGRTILIQLQRWLKNMVYMILNQKNC